MHQEESPPPARREVRHLDRIAALLAGAIGALALGVSVYGVFLQRTQIRAQVWPRLELSYTPAPAVVLRLDNVGVGPAKIRLVSVTVDEKPVATWAEAAKLLVNGAPMPAGTACSSSTMHGRVVAAGAGFDVIRCEDGPFAAMLRRERPRLGVELCFCSVLDECWMLGSGDRDEPVAACPKRPVAFQD